VGLFVAGVILAKPIYYQGPESGATATITFQNESDMQAVIYVYEHGELCKRRRLLKFNNSLGFTKIKINSKNRIAFEYGLKRGKRKACVYTLSFLPTSNDHYLVAARTSRNKKKCHLQLIRLHAEGIYSRVNFEIRRPRSSFSNKGAHCLPLTEQQKRVFTDE